ncbi:Pvc16 family protein [Rivihabitans pingtungensis]|uniref:Pvc16 family protein n=1 Tax=Rivihabitans pingtungensis TaxID=1054498 RepID=UPI00235711B5|nr:Pvc16 family protein [Rivihabitans pingtungensis]MCK6436739.1 DUF4255 domain-containing protein [Rivihabitans pingtungensis]
MLDVTLQFLQQQLNAALQQQLASAQPLARLASLVQPDGQPTAGLGNCLVMSLLNVERESAAPMLPPGYSPAQAAPSLHLNLDMLCTALCARYEDALRLLSLTLGFFQAQPLFTADMPGFPPGLGKLSVELRSLDLNTMNNLWGMLGAKHQPAVVFRVRMLSLHSGPRQLLPAVSQPAPQVGRQT